MDEKLIEVSRTISYALRHNPDEFGLVLDDAGWVLVDELIAAIKASTAMLHWVDENTLYSIQKESHKQRFEILNGSIRAMYGHSLPKQNIKLTPSVPPSILYHGTTIQAVNQILKHGIQPMQRQYVHLSTDLTTAIIVGKRRTKKPVVLEIDAKSAHEHGIHFYHGNENIWLADTISPLYIKFDETNKNQT
jgi:putative RNA 2'-phosphotransferase